MPQNGIALEWHTGPWVKAASTGVEGLVDIVLGKGVSPSGLRRFLFYSDSYPVV